MKAIVVEDSRLAREGLLRMLEVHTEIDIVGSAENVEEALQLVDQHTPDLLFLDINMPGESGFELLELLSYEPKVVFTTAYSDYAIRSFDYNTVDYLLKPISKERLDEAIKKLLRTSENASMEFKPEDKLDFNSRIFVKDEDKCHLIELDEIDYIESCKNYVRLYFGGNKAFVKKSLAQAEKRLPDKKFFRVNRQFIVNIKAIVSIEETVGDGYEITMRDGEKLEISRRNSQVLKDLLSL